MQIFSNYAMTTYWSCEVREAAPGFKEGIRVHFYSKEGSISIYMTQEQAEAVAFQIQSFVQEAMREKSDD